MSEERDTLNMMAVSIKEFAEEIRADIEDGNYLPAIGIGLSGVGKTSALRELAEKEGIGYKEIRLINHVETDLIGVPIIEETASGKRTTFAANDMLPRVDRDGEIGILVLDEVTSASTSIRTVALQLLDSSRGVGNYKLPEKWKIVALGNGPDDGGNFQGIESAVLNRGGTSFRIEADYKCWYQWAKSNMVHPAILAHLDLNEGEFYQLYPDQENGCMFPSPRSWKALSDKLYARERRQERETGNNILPSDKVTLYAAGCIGLRAAAKFAGIYKFMETTKAKLNTKDIIEGKCVKESGQIGSREFKTPDINNIGVEALHIAIESVTLALSAVVKKYDYESDNPESLPENKAAVMACVNCIKWALSLEKVNKDLCMHAITSFSKADDEGKAYYILAGNLLDGLLPEYQKFCERNASLCRV